MASVVNQTYSNLEIIMVDDGSMDHCPEICDKWAKKDSRIKVIHKKNEGLGKARNTGIEYATGEYICFFDSDDYIARETIEKAYEAGSRDQAEIVLFGMVFVDKNGKEIGKQKPVADKTVYSDEEILNDILPHLIARSHKDGSDKQLIMSSCCAMFSNQLIMHYKWKFVSEREIISEDIYSLLMLYQYVKKVTILGSAYYYYCENESSLTHTYRPDRYEKNKHFYLECLRLCDQLGYSDEIKEQVSSPYISNTIAALKQICQSNTKHKLRNCKNIFKDDVFCEVVGNMKAKYEGPRKFFIYAVRYKMYTVAYLFLWMMILK